MYFAHFKTLEPQFPKDNISFFSGHTAFTFAMATSTGYLLEKSYPTKSALIWSSGLLVASFTGYLRTAADRHYMSDVLTGAFVGTLSSYLIVKNQKKKFFQKKSKNSPFMMSFVFPL